MPETCLKGLSRLSTFYYILEISPWNQNIACICNRSLSTHFFYSHIKLSNYAHPCTCHALCMSVQTLYSCIHLFQANENNLFTELSETEYSVCIHYTQVILHHEIILPSTIGKGENRNLCIMYLTYLICLYIFISTCIECKCVIHLLQFYLLLVLLIKKHRLLLHICLLIPTVQQFHICSLNYHWLAS